MDVEERALLAGIIANPEEDTPRLVYADWLQEHDQPERAEYIRLSIQLANLQYGDPDYDTRYWQLRAERDPLVTRFVKIWQEEFAGRFPKAGGVTFIFSRGFVEEVWCSPTFFLKNAECLLREAPIRSLNPRTPTLRTAAALVANPWFRQLSRLGFHEATSALTLLNQPALDIREINCSQFLPAKGWSPVAVLLAQHPGMRSLCEIDFEGCRIDDTGGQALADSPRLNPKLLNVIDNEFSQPVCLALRARYGLRVWLDPTDRNGFPRG
jgi:uncharacterized protein (TIGR02996 family)